MILCRGELLARERQGEVLERLPRWIDETLDRPPLTPDVTIAACDRLSRRAEAGEFDAELAGLDLDPALKEEQVAAALNLLRRESLEAMAELQLGRDPFAPVTVRPPYYDRPIVKRRRPLGVLLHIAAGNLDALPAFTVVEGLLAGNINLLKLPSADHGLSVALLRKLVEEEPALRDYVYVFDTPSDDVAALRRLAGLCDGVVVWGGEAAVSAVRALALPGIKLIEWGHRLGFAYVTQRGREEGQLSALAGHIMQTKQLLCSSCQTIFLDTEEPEELRELARQFLPLLEAAARRWPVRDMGALAQGTLRRYTARLEEAAGFPTPGDTVLEGKGCSLTLKWDRELELSPQFGSPVLKCLPRAELLPTLRRSRGVLQTAGLLCAPEERGALTETLLRAGLVRVTGPGELSRGTCLDAHDGEYPLLRYTRITEADE